MGLVLSPCLRCGRGPSVAPQVFGAVICTLMELLALGHNVGLLVVHGQRQEDHCMNVAVIPIRCTDDCTSAITVFVNHDKLLCQYVARPCL